MLTKYYLIFEINIFNYIQYQMLKTMLKMLIIFFNIKINMFKIIDIKDVKNYSLKFLTISVT